MARAMQTITVKSGLPQQKDGGFPLAIFDRDPVYGPENESGGDGELFIADDKTHTVPLTAAVRTALNEGRLTEADGDGDEAGAGDGEENDAGYSLAELKRLTRPELDALAATEGIEGADAMATKDEVAQAIYDKQD